MHVSLRDIYVASRTLGEADRERVYVDPDGVSGWNANCMNTHDGKPMCIVGHLLSDIFGVENIPSRGSADMTLLHLKDAGHTFEGGVEEFLAILQVAQDKGAPWFAAHGAAATAFGLLKRDLYHAARMV